MTDYTSQITALYEAIEFRAPPAADIAAFNAELNAGNYTPAQVTSLITSQIESSSYVQNFVNPVIRMYEAALGRVPDQAGLSYWVNQVATNPNALNNLATIFANSQEFMLDYGATQGASTPNNPALVYALYKNILGRTPDQAGLTYWENSGLDAAQLLAAFISPNDTEYVTDTTPFVTQFENLEATGMEPTTGSLFNIPIPGGVTTYTIELGQSAIDYTITGTLGGQTITGVLTSGSGLAPITGTSNVVINAPYGLNDFQSIMLTGSNNVLNANYGPGANFSQTGLNIQGVQTWNIQTAGPAIAGYSGLAAGETPAVISFTGDAAQGNLISGLTTVNFNDNSSDNTLLIGDNSEPVQEPNGANGFAINVSNAVGYYNPTTDVINGVDVDIAAQAFTGKDTINISANIVGGFGELNGSYVIPALELSAPNDGDDYNPNWLGFEENAFSISAGASSGPNGAIGFQNWVVSSTGAKSVGSMNILALGGEGSTTAQTLTVSDDGSPTMLFATAISDSLSSDWENLTTIDLTKTSGNIVLTGAEVDAAQGALTGVVGIGGLLTSDTTALVTIKGGTGNSFYDLSSLTAGAAVNPNALFQGGTSTKGNSEIAFNNSVLTAGAKVNIANIQVLDDTGGAPATGLSGLPLINGQGGTINMADFQTLGALNANYDLMSGPLGNLFYTNTHSAFSSAGSIYQDPTFAASTDVAPAGYQLLQLLDADGSTENVLTTGLTIADGFVQFAINMMDVADGSVTPAVRGSVYDNMFGNPVTATNHYSAAYTIGADPFANSQDPIAYGDAYFVADTNVYNLYSAPLETLTGQNIYIYQQDPTFNVNVQSHLKLWLADEGVNVYDHTGTLLLGSIFDAPQFTIDNYTTVDIYLPFEFDRRSGLGRSRFAGQSERQGLRRLRRHARGHGAADHRSRLPAGHRRPALRRVELLRQHPRHRWFASRRRRRSGAGLHQLHRRSGSAERPGVLRSDRHHRLRQRGDRRHGPDRHLGSRQGQPGDRRDRRQRADRPEHLALDHGRSRRAAIYRGSRRSPGDAGHRGVWLAHRPEPDARHARGAALRHQRRLPDGVRRRDLRCRRPRRGGHHRPAHRHHRHVGECRSVAIRQRLPDRRERHGQGRRGQSGWQYRRQLLPRGRPGHRGPRGRPRRQRRVRHRVCRNDRRLFDPHRHHRAAA